ELRERERQLHRGVELAAVRRGHRRDQRRQLEPVRRQGAAQREGLERELGVAHARPRSTAAMPSAVAATQPASTGAAWALTQPASPGSSPRDIAIAAALLIACAIIDGTTESARIAISPSTKPSVKVGSAW